MKETGPGVDIQWFLVGALLWDEGFLWGLCTLLPWFDMDHLS